MSLLDNEIHRAKALVIDANATARSVMTAQLKDLGVGQVRQIARVQDARLALEAEAFDIVLAELDFDGAPMSGQDLLDELKREQILPYHTVFMVVTGEATYARVVEAGEASVDGYLIKPYAASTLADRLAEARRRKRTLKAVYEALHRQDHLRAAVLAQQHFDQRAAYWNFAAQVASELWLRLGEAQRALGIYNAVLQQQPLHWARLGVARARLALGELAPARRQLDAMVTEQPHYADAHDLLARVLVDQAEMEEALDAFRTCVELTPGCMLRLQHCGTLAFYLGHAEESHRMLERALSMGRRSKLFDALSLALLALLRYDRADDKGLAVAHEQAQRFAEEHPNSMRIARIERIASALRLLRLRHIDDALAMARTLAADMAEPQFDLEAASLVLALWARLPREEVPAKEWDHLLRSSGLRYCVSKTVTEVLVASVRPVTGAADIVRSCHQVVFNLAEQALNQSMDGKPTEAVELLLQQGSHTRNAKLIDMAGAVAQRHAKALRQPDALMQRTQALRERYCQAITHIAGIRRSARSPGGVVMRA